MNSEIQVQRAVSLIDQILPMVTDAKKKMNAAGLFGFADMFGGGFIIDLIKHSQINSASREMNQVSGLLNELKQCLGNIQMGSDYRMEVNGCLTFADFFFDGFIFDTWMMSKIWNSVNELNKLEQKLLECRQQLVRL